MPSIRSTLTYASGLLGSLLIAGSVMVCQHSGAAAATNEHKPPAAAAPPAKASTPKKIANAPSWQALTTAQQLALVPLAGEWDSIDSQRKEKWIAIANKYARMSPSEQNRIQTRMRDWIKLTPEERRSVRQSYASTKKWDSDQKSAQWQQYLQLSDAQKAQLAKQKLSPAPATAISRARPKPKTLLPIAQERGGRPVAGAALPATAASTPAAPTVPRPAAVAPAAPAIAPPPAGAGIAAQPNNK